MGVTDMTSEMRTLPEPSTWEGGGALDIRCPRCSKRCIWEEPFLLYLEQRVSEDAITSQMRRWAGRVVVEKYPSILPWVAPGSTPRGIAGGPEALRTQGTKTPTGARQAGYHVMRQVGVVHCPHCHLAATHQLNWPQDAYFQWIIRGHILWAWSREHAQVLLAFLGSVDRDATKYPAYAESLRTLPKQLITAKLRPLVVKRITETLAGDDC